MSPSGSTLRAVPGLVPGLVLVATALFAVGCRESAGPAPTRAAPLAPEVLLSPEGADAVHVKVEVARTRAELQQGLMYREKLEPGRGMVFLFDHPHHLEFWMHNTYIPLDMIFIGADFKVVGVVENAAPLTDDPRGVEGISQYVLEVPGGYAVAHRIGPGTTTRFVDIEPILRSN